MQTPQRPLPRALVLAALLFLASCGPGSAPVEERRGPAPAREPAEDRETPVARQTEETFAEPEPYFPFLDDEADDTSLSLGTVSEGYLVNAVPLPQPGLHYEVLPRQWERGLLYGTEEMIHLLEEVAEIYHRKHGKRLQIGNIGRKGGGDIPWSVSHNSGRDVDIAFAYTRGGQKSAYVPDLLALGPEGRSKAMGGRYHFDAASTWTIVRALLTSREARVQYIFLSNPLKKQVLAYAKRQKTHRGLLQKAERVLLQPANALPHNDHLHVRIFCTPEDLENGCVDSGASLIAEKRTAKHVQMRATEIANRLHDANFEIRARAIERLALLRAHEHLEKVKPMLHDAHPRVRAAAAIALGDAKALYGDAAILGRLRAEHDASVQVHLVRALEHWSSAAVGQRLRELVNNNLYDAPTPVLLPAKLRAHYQKPESGRNADPALMSPSRRAIDDVDPQGQTLSLRHKSFSVRLAAIEAAAWSERPEVVPALIYQLEHKDPLVRLRAARALRYLTNHSFDVRWGDGSRESRIRGMGAWLEWYSLYKDEPRSAWVRAGFQVRGKRVKNVDAQHVWALLQSILEEDHLSYNAQRSLMRLTGESFASLQWPRLDACRHWYGVLRSYGRKQKLPRGPQNPCTP